MSTELNPPDAAKQAIDLRLDAIDHALLGLLPRHERIELVAQIETKLRESAAHAPADAKPHSAPDLPHRPDEIESALSGPTSYLPHLSDRRFFPRRRPRSRVAVSSGVLGIVAVALLAALPFIYVLISMLNMDGSFAGFLLVGQLAAVALCGLLAVVLGIAGLVVLSRQAGRLIGHGWAITGLCTGPLPLFAGGLVALAIGSELWGSVMVQPVYSTAPVAMSPPAAAYGSYPALPTPTGGPPTVTPAANNMPLSASPDSDFAPPTCAEGMGQPLVPPLAEATEAEAPPAPATDAEPSAPTAVR